MSDLVLHVLMLVGGCGALYFGAEWLVRGAARIAANMGISPIVVGLTLVSLGTSAPELVVGIAAALEDKVGVLMGNVMGSNLANIGLILGATAVIRPLAVPDRVISRDVPIMVLVTILVYPLVLDYTVDLGDGVILLALLIVYIAFTFRTAEEDMSDLQEEPDELGEGAEEPEGAQSLLANLGLVAAGAVGLAFGGRAIVEGASELAIIMGVSEEVVGLTIVAVGTSLPELVTSIVAAARQQTDIAVGNIVGSNIFNLTAVLGTSALVRELTVDPSILARQLPAVFIISLLVWPVAASARKVRRSEGVLLLAAYFGFMVWITVAA
ncbi:MAG: calcium/sodium antiporter [Gemmatimonadota bacterium]|nr:calcium/sodium antiporter [Gemmatimonadota bacterium]MDE2985323.1 calcium/sodium antiporter [Gemmatimonadota bacterium]